MERAIGIRLDVKLAAEDVYVSHGFVERRAVNRQKVPRTRSVTFDEAQVGYLSKTLALLRDNKTPVILVWAPVPSTTLESEQNLPHLRASLLDFAKKHRVEFLDLNRCLQLDNHLDFFDDDHLNQRGVDKLMPVFANLLRERNLLPDVN